MSAKVVPFGEIWHILSDVSIQLKSVTHYENTSIQIYIENFTSKKLQKKNQIKKLFHIFAQNIDCGTR